MKDLLLTLTSPGRHDREAVWPRWRASGARGAFSAQVAADRRALLLGGASHEAEGRRGARDSGAGRVRAPAGRLRRCVLRQIGDQPVAGLEQFLFVDDVVAAHPRVRTLPHRAVVLEGAFFAAMLVEWRRRAARELSAAATARQSGPFRTPAPGVSILRSPGATGGAGLVGEDRSPMKRDEDQEQTLVFVDMLGFAALTEKHPHRIEDDPPTDDGFEVSRSAPTQSQFNRFNDVLDYCIHQRLCDGGITAMLFSDCAFLNPENSLRAALIATDLMREFIKASVPVRMGIGKGTFDSFGYSTDAGADSMLVNKSRFIGALLHESSRAPHDAHRQDPHRPMRYDTGRPRAVIRFKISQPRTASLPCPAGLRARRPSPMMDL